MPLTRQFGNVSTDGSLAVPEVQQYLRSCTLIVSNAQRGGLDLSKMHIKFQIKRSNTQTPNTADILVYNLSEETATQIKKEFTKVVLQAGYENNAGVIFQGNIKQVIVGRESATDTFINIIAGDGDLAYNFSIVNTTLAPGATLNDQANAAATSMSKMGTNAGFQGEMPPGRLPRGKVMFGNAREYMRDIAQTSNQDWSIQDGEVQFLPLRAYAKGTAIEITSKTGMIGTPQQTNEGLNVKCLINPLIKVGGRIKIDNAAVAAYKINLAQPNSPANIAPPLTADGVYFVYVIEYTGDTRGIDWYSNLVCLTIDSTTNPINSVQTNYGE